jgi:hypothetical protein
LDHSARRSFMGAQFKLGFCVAELVVERLLWLPNDFNPHILGFTFADAYR